MSIELIKSELIEEAQQLPRQVTLYKLVNKEPGRGGTWLTLLMKVTQLQRINRIKIEMPDLVVEEENCDTEAAIDKLATWMERAAKELRARGKPAIAVAHYPEGNP
jgi:hypothetical protein